MGQVVFAMHTGEQALSSEGLKTLNQEFLVDTRFDKVLINPLAP